MNPQNKEHMEAIQSSVNEARNQMIKNLPEEDQKKYQAVEEACKILSDAKIPAYVLPVLPVINSKGKIKAFPYQYNTLAEISEYDNAGNYSDYDLERVSRANHAFAYSVFNHFARAMFPNNEKLEIKDVNYILFEIGRISSEYSQYLLNDIEFPDIEKLREGKI